MSPLAAEPPSHLSIKHPAPYLVQRRCRQVPSQDSIVWSCIVHSAFITFFPFNKLSLGHCRQVGSPDLPLTPTETVLRMDTEPHGFPSSAQAQLLLQQLVLRPESKQRAFKEGACFNRCVSLSFCSFVQKLKSHLNKQESEGKIPSS